MTNDTLDEVPYGIWFNVNDISEFHRHFAVQRRHDDLLHEQCLSNSHDVSTEEGRQWFAEVLAMRVVKIDETHYQVYEDPTIADRWREKWFNMNNLVYGLKRDSLIAAIEAQFPDEVPCTCCNFPLKALKSKMWAMGAMCHADECKKVAWFGKHGNVVERLLDDSGSMKEI